MHFRPRKGQESLIELANGFGAPSPSFEDHAVKEEERADFAVFSHNMRTLLTSIIGFSELLLLKYFNEYPQDAKEYLQYIREAGLKLDRLLGISVLRHIQDRYDCSQKVTVSELVSNCCKRVKEKASAVGVKLVEELTPGTEAILVEDMLLGETLIGLLIFAVERTPAGGNVGLSISRSGENVLFTVWHTFSSQWQEFNRGSMNMNPETERILVLARELSKINGGRFWVEGTLGEISSFCLLLPTV